MLAGFHFLYKSSNLKRSQCFVRRKRLSLAVLSDLSPMLAQKSTLELHTLVKYWVNAWVWKIRVSRHWTRCLKIVCVTYLSLLIVKLDFVKNGLTPPSFVVGVRPLLTQQAHLSLFSSRLGCTHSRLQPKNSILIFWAWTLLASPSSMFFYTRLISFWTLFGWSHFLISKGEVNWLLLSYAVFWLF